MRAANPARRALRVRKSLGTEAIHVATSRKRRSRMMVRVGNTGGKRAVCYAPEYQIAAQIRGALTPDVLAELPGNAQTMATMDPKKRADMVRLYGPLSNALKEELDRFDAKQRKLAERAEKRKLRSKSGKAEARSTSRKRSARKARKRNRR